jgi:hypothetical protein
VLLALDGSRTASVMADSISVNRSVNASGSSGSGASINQVLMTAAHPPVTNAVRSSSSCGAGSAADIPRTIDWLNGASRLLSATVSR